VKIILLVESLPPKDRLGRKSSTDKVSVLLAPRYQEATPMPAYMIVQSAISDEQRFQSYREAVVPLIATYGGRPVVASASVEILEGQHDGRRLVIFQFPSLVEIRRFWASPDYALVKELRKNAATVDVWAVQGA
jgi:uncharacterized protein (DUF1330 family)